MKKLILFLVIITTSCAVHSQSSNDTIILRISDAKRVLKAAEQSKLLAYELAQKSFEISKLNERINLKEDNISDLQKRIDLKADIIEKLQQNERLANYNNELLTAQYEAYKKEATKTAKKQRNKAFWRGGVIGVAATLVAIILIK